MRLLFRIKAKKTELRRLEEDETWLATLRAAIDEGDASPDVNHFNRDAFLEELIEESKGMKRNG